MLSHQLAVHQRAVHRVEIFNPQLAISKTEPTVNSAGPGVTDTHIRFVPTTNRGGKFGQCDIPAGGGGVDAGKAY